MYIVHSQANQIYTHGRRQNVLSNKEKRNVHTQLRTWVSHAHPPYSRAAFREWENGFSQLSILLMVSRERSEQPYMVCHMRFGMTSRSG